MNRHILVACIVAVLAGCAESDKELIAKARALMDQQDLAAAVIHLKNALGHNPNSGEARLLLDRLFQRHPASSRTIAVLHYLDGLTLEQVASEVGQSVSGVRKRLRSLRHALGEMTT